MPDTALSEQGQLTAFAEAANEIVRKPIRGWGVRTRCRVSSPEASVFYTGRVLLHFRWVFAPRLLRIDTDVSARPSRSLLYQRLPKDDRPGYWECLLALGFGPLAKERMETWAFTYSRGVRCHHHNVYNS